MGVEEMREKARQKRSRAKEKGAALIEKGVDGALDAAQRFIDEFNAMQPRFEAAGYTLVDLEMKVGVPPVFAPCFRRTRPYDPEERAAHLEAMDDRKLGKLVLTTLFDTSALQARLNMGDLHVYGIVIELGAQLPAARVRYIDGAKAELLGLDDG